MTAAIEYYGSSSSAVKAASIVVNVFGLDVHSRAIVMRFFHHIPALIDEPQCFSNASRPRAQLPL